MLKHVVHTKAKPFIVPLNNSSVPNFNMSSNSLLLNDGWLAVPKPDRTTKCVNIILRLATY